MSAMPQISSPLFLMMPDGVEIAVPPRLRCMTTYVLLEQGDWFEQDIVFLRHALQPGMKVIDVGANFGVYTLSIARTIGPQGQLWAFEPAADTADYLAQSLDKNNFQHVHLIRAALSAHEGEGLLFHDRREELFQVDLAGAMGTAPGQHETIALQNLDGLMARLEHPVIDFIKIDAEGHEIEILKGGLGFFTEQHPVVMLEIIAPDGGTNLDLVDAFRAAGYEFFELLPGPGILVPTNEANINRILPLNVYALKPAFASDWVARGLLALDPELPRVTPSYENALALWHRSNQTELSANQRAGCLMEAAEILQNLANSKKNLPLLLSLARVMMDMGYRNHAHDALSDARQWLEAGQPVDAEISRLPLIDRLGDLQQDQMSWLPRIILELKDRWESYSSFFRLESSCAINREIVGTPGHSSEAMRRYLLARSMLEGRVLPELTNLMQFRELVL